MYSQLAKDISWKEDRFKFYFFLSLLSVCYSLFGLLISLSTIQMGTSKLCNISLSQATYHYHLRHWKSPHKFIIFQVQMNPNVLTGMCTMQILFKINKNSVTSLAIDDSKLFQKMETFQETFLKPPSNRISCIVKYITGPIYKHVNSNPVTNL